MTAPVATPKSISYNTNINPQTTEILMLFLFIACLFKPQTETPVPNAFERLLALETPVPTPNVEIVYAEIEINGELAYADSF